MSGDKDEIVKRGKNMFDFFEKIAEGIGFKLINNFSEKVTNWISDIFEQINEKEEGNSAQVASSGYYAKVASSGYSAQVASSGDSAQVASSGYSAQVVISGDKSVGFICGLKNIIKAKKRNMGFCSRI